MSSTLDCGYNLAGTIKFDHSVSLEQLTDLMRAIKVATNGDRLIDLHVRSVDNESMWCMAFHFVLETNTLAERLRAERHLLEFFRTMLGTQPGNRLPNGVVEWSVSGVQAIA